MRGQNAVDFDLDIATVYDRTRPFPKRAAWDALFHPIFSAVFESSHIEGKFRVLDAGCGTGRIAVPLLRSYENWRNADSQVSRPQIELAAVDISPHMIQQCRLKLAGSGISLKDPRFRLINEDIRDPSFHRLGKFHLIISHWLFHTILDWRTAALQLDGAAAEGACLLLFNEKSAFYQALDGDLSDLSEGEPGYRFWSAFHANRREASRHHRHAKLMPPSMRLGPKVSDERVAQMFRALGWKGVPLSVKPVSFDQSFTIEELIEKVAFSRSFTNLRIGNQDSLEEIYSDIAQDLRTKFVADGMIHNTARFRYRLTASLFTRPRERTLSAASIVDTIRDTVSVRRSHGRYDLYDRPKLWARLFGTALPRLTSAEGSLDLSGDHLEFVIATAPYGAKYYHGIHETRERELEDLWGWLANNVETDDLVHIWRSSKRPLQLPYDGSPMVPFETRFALDDATWRALTLLGTNWHSPTDDRALRKLTPEIKAKLLRQARRVGLIGFDDDVDIADHFVGALAAVVSMASAKRCDHIYFLPVEGKVDNASSDHQATARDNNNSPIFGMLVGSGKRLSHSTISLLWLIVDLLITDFYDHRGSRPGETQPVVPIDPYDTKVLCPQPVPRFGSSFELVDNGAADLLVLTINPRERRAIASCFADKSLRSRDASLPMVWKTTKGFQVAHVNIPKGACSDDVTQWLDIYKPRVAILSGTMGGFLPNQHAFGDVIVVTEVLVRDEVDKLPEGVRIPREGAWISLPPRREQWLRLRASEWNKRPFRMRNGVNKVFAGRLLSGRGLEADRDDLDFVRSIRLPKGKSKARLDPLLGFEMEAVDFCRAMLKYATRPAWAIVKGICDFIDNHNYYQPVAAFRAAEFIRYLCDLSDPITGSGMFSPEFLDDSEDQE